MDLHVIDLKIKEWRISQENIVINNIHLLKNILSHIYIKKNTSGVTTRNSQNNNNNNNKTHIHTNTKTKTIPN